MTQVGVVFPQGNKGIDAAGVRDFGTGVEQLGFRHVLAYDHVVGADPSVHQGWNGAYDVDTPFHEPFVTFGFLAGITSLEFVTGVVILPQRQTVLVAKQAAQIDILSGGKLTLGVGVGWNQVEYEALGADFANRGKVLDEQITLLRRLLTERSVSFSGDFHSVTGAGIAPLPVQRPIPIFLGGAAPVAFRRIGRVADGWFPMQTLAVKPDRIPAFLGALPPLQESTAVVAEAARKASRDPKNIQTHAQAYYLGDVQEVLDQIEAWQEFGAAYVSVNTLSTEFTTATQHLDALAQIAERAGLRPSHHHDQPGALAR